MPLIAAHGKGKGQREKGKGRQSYLNENLTRRTVHSSRLLFSPGIFFPLPSFADSYEVQWGGQKLCAHIHDYLCHFYSYFIDIENRVNWTLGSRLLWKKEYSRWVLGGHGTPDRLSSDQAHL